MTDSRADDAPASIGNQMNDQQLGQHKPTFSPSKLAHSPKKPSPLRQCQIASIPDFTPTSPTRLSSNETTPTKMSSLREQSSADYLRELRTNRAAKLNGSRPPPPSRIASKRQRPSTSAGETIMSTNCPRAARDEPAQTSVIDYRAHSRSKSMETGGRNNYAGRPLVPAPPTIITGTLPIIPDSDETPMSSPPVYSIEGNHRSSERQEAHSLRKALEEVHLDEEHRIHFAAQDEAAELVHKHRTGQDSPSQAYKNPDVFKDQPIKDYRAHLRTRSALPWNTVPSEVTSPKSSPKSTEPRPLSASHFGSQIRSSPRSHLPATLSGDDDPFIEQAAPPQSSKGKSYEKLAGAVASDVAQSRRRASSGANKRKPSEGQKAEFPSPSNRIFEEPDNHLKEAREAEAEKAAEKAAEKTQEKVEEVPRHVRRNPFARVRQVQEKFERKESPSGYSVKRFDVDDERPRSSPSSGRRFDRVEIHRNPPTQSRKAGYLTNDTSPESPLQIPEEISDVEASPVMKDGIEIRSDDIRAATSMRRKDRSSNLIQPTAVSDSPGRPIVSFEQDWQTKEIELVEERVEELPNTLSIGKNPPSPEALSGKAQPYSPARSKAPALPRPGSQQAASKPTAIPHISLPSPPQTKRAPPTIQIPGGNMPGGLPSIVVPDDPESPSKTLPENPEVPSIVLPNDSSKPTVPVINEPFNVEEPPRPRTAPSSRPLPVPGSSRPSSSQGGHGRPLPSTSRTTPLPDRSQPHYTPSVRRTTALCAHCALPIAGRILSAAGERFHPACFKCHQCGINLECVAFYPEPEQKRLERLARIHHRQQGLDTYLPDGVTEEDMMRLEEADGDEGLRFFCHLDFHEMFSPRCKSCKTPIEGEVVVACGSEWHVGHFFCAQCGDPFDSSTPFVEKEGYAWCVGCHTNRYSAKCKRCRKPVTDVVLKALGAEWHAECFVCNECNGQFEDGRYFLRGADQNPVCVRCEERRLKA